MIHARPFRLLCLIPGLACAEPLVEPQEAILPDPDAPSLALKPEVITEASPHDTDDPAIWINAANPAASLVIGTDKHHDGALLAYGLDGKIQWARSVRGLLRPNNVDIVYSVTLGTEKVDLAIVTERFASRLRAFRLPEMAAVDGGGWPVFEGEQARGPMGIALYKRPSDGALFVTISRSPEHAPRDGYLAQYRVTDDGTGVLRATHVRNFGTWSGKKEIEALAVDTELGFLYAADERFGIRKYRVDPDAPEANQELAVFGREGFGKDREGISIYPTGPGKGYILVSNQAADTFRVFPREGVDGQINGHPLLAAVRVSTRESDGSDITATPLPGYPAGLFVAMSTDRTFHYYDAGKILGVIEAALAAKKKP